MEIDFNTVTIGDHTGYGNASRLLVKSLTDQGVKITPGSSIMLNFSMPPAYKYADITIGYTPWESTEVPESWLYGLASVDALWATTDWVADVLARARNMPNSGRSAVKTIPHGIEECWVPLKRERGSEPFTFIHVGEPAVRKGGDILLQAWHKAFKDRDDVKLIFKCIKYPACRIKDKSGSLIASPGMYDNIQVISSVYSQQEMLDLYYSSHCMVYPTRGEGFGLIPFEAMASGLPTILPSQGGTGQFSHYSRLPINGSMWSSSTSELIHPGLWLDHNVDEVIDLMNCAIDNYASISEDAFNAAHQLHIDYNWNRIASMVIEEIESLL